MKKLLLKTLAISALFAPALSFAGHSKTDYGKELEYSEREYIAAKEAVAKYPYSRLLKKNYKQAKKEYHEAKELAEKYRVKHSYTHRNKHHNNYRDYGHKKYGHKHRKYSKYKKHYGHGHDHHYGRDYVTKTFHKDLNNGGHFTVRTTKAVPNYHHPYYGKHYNHGYSKYSHPHHAVNSGLHFAYVLNKIFD